MMKGGSLSTDECGAFLEHITNRFDSLADGTFFVQADGEYCRVDEIGRIAEWSARPRGGGAPHAFIPLSRTLNVGVDEPHSSCLADWSEPVFGSNSSLAHIHRSGHHSKGLFFASRQIVHRRSRAFWSNLLNHSRTAAFCNFHSTPAHLDCRKLAVQLNQSAKLTLPSLDVCRQSKFSACRTPCAFLEHIWAQVLCEPCVTPKRMSAWIDRLDDEERTHAQESQEPGAWHWTLQLLAIAVIVLLATQAR